MNVERFTKWADQGMYVYEGMNWIYTTINQSDRYT